MHQAPGLGGEGWGHGKRGEKEGDDILGGVFSSPVNVIAWEGERLTNHDGEKVRGGPGREPQWKKRKSSFKAG